MSKLSMLVIGGAGYVLGARAGRERYDQIRTTVTKVRRNPRVQAQARHAADTVKEQAPVIRDRVSGVASAAAAKVRSVDTDAKPPTGTANNPAT